MDISSIPEAFQSKIRLAIISSLITGEKTFNQVKEATQASDGNLSIHLTRLEESDYIVSSKYFVGKKPRTTYKLTDNGRRGFGNYVKMLEQILNQDNSK
ncbi:MAG TPA: transcriptional regulator [Ruminiclostridium sp.]